MELLDEIPGIVRNEPQGAFYIFPNISYFIGKSVGDKTIKNDVDLSMYLLENANVAVVPGGAFGNDSCIRFSYAASENELKTALKRIKNTLAKLQ